MPYRGGRREQAQLKYPENYYVPGSMAYRKLSEKEIRAEYSRLRSIARKRLERLAVSEPDSKIYKRYAGTFPRTPDITSKADLARKFADVASFVTDPRSSLKTSRALDRTITETLGRHGIKIKPSELKQFGEFMEFSRARRKSRHYDSDQTAETYKQAERLGVDPELLKKDFTYFYNNVETMSQIESLPQDKKATAFQLRKAIKLVKKVLK